MQIGMLMPKVYTSSEPSSLKLLMSKPNPMYPWMESWLILTSEPIIVFVNFREKDSVFQNCINCNNCKRCMLKRIWCLVVNGRLQQYWSLNPCRMWQSCVDETTSRHWTEYRMIIPGKQVPQMGSVTHVTPYSKNLRTNYLYLRGN